MARIAATVTEIGIEMIAIVAMIDMVARAVTTFIR